ncbi:MAG: hypothetical protein KF684_01445 [Phycisphaeraceae bacterium]|nr:hypothetical protein [Phycisphaeraceae bacterium]
MKIGILAGAVGLAVSAVALAEAAKTSDLIPISRVSTVDSDIQVYRQTGWPALTDGIVGQRRSPLTGLRAEMAPVETAQEYVSLRGTPNVVSVKYNYENAPADTSTGGLGFTRAASFQSGTLPGTMYFNVRGQTSVNFVRVIDPANPLTPAPAAGPNGVANQTKMMRHRVGAAQAPGGFFTGHNARLISSETDLVAFFPLAPTADNDARVSFEVYNTTTAEQNTFEPVALFTGFVTARILWGGTCVETTPGDCTDFGLPVGPITTMLSLGPDPASFTTGIFVPCLYCRDAQGMNIPGCTPPAGFSVGQPVQIPIGTWHRMIGETSSDARVNVYIDYLNGNPEVAIYSNTILTSGFLDRVGSNASFEAAEAETFFDNISFDGEPFALPTAPTLACPYLDDFEWLNTGPVLGQTSRIFAALSSALTVINDGGQGQVLSQINNVSSDNKFRQEFRETLPNAYALPGDPWSFCTNVRLTGSTVRAIALDSEATNFIVGGVTARVYIGREDPNNIMNPFYEPTVYVQINPEYDPIDDPFTTTPQDNVPVIGVDIASTGTQWTFGSYRDLCMTVDIDNNLTVSVNGTTIYSGTAFANAAAVVYHESENQAFGSGATLRVADHDFQCSALPVVVLPDFTLTYNDNMEWGIPGIPPVRHIDDPMGAPTASTRYTNANGVVMDSVNLLRGSSTAVAMANIFRDTAQVSPPNPNGTEAFQFTQFTTRVPNITVSGSTRWVIEADFAFSDFTTSRGWSPAKLSPAGGAFFLGSTMWYSAQDDTFYVWGAQSATAMPGDDVLVTAGPTRSSLGILANQAFRARVEYNLSTGKIDWKINGTAIGSTFPNIVTNPVTQQPLVVRDLDAIFVFSGDDDTGTPTAPFSVYYMDNLNVSTGQAPCPGDTNGDRIINFSDLNAVLSTFGQSGAGIPGDVNGDGVVNFSDLNIVLSNFGVTCP